MSSEELRFRAAGIAGAALLRAMGATWRVSVVNGEPVREFRRAGQPFIFVLWHSRLLPLAYLHRDENIVVLVSEHGDGEYVTRVLDRLGYGTGRGSSTRGGARGLRNLLRAMRDGHDIGFTPDGPRGPARVCKPGVLVAGQLTGAPMVPLAIGGSAVWRVGSWDRMIVPKPFARLTLMYGRPMYVPRDSSPEDLERTNAELQAELDRVTDLVDGVSEARDEPSRPASSAP